MTSIASSHCHDVPDGGALRLNALLPGKSSRAGARPTRPILVQDSAANVPAPEQLRPLDLLDTRSPPLAGSAGLYKQEGASAGRD